VGSPLIEKAGTDGVDDDDGVVAVVSNVVHKSMIGQLVRIESCDDVLTCRLRRWPTRSYHLLHQPRH
jgi:hypothetical protein